MSTAQESRRPAGPSRPPNRTTILVVDDDPEVRTLARDILAAEGYAVLEAPGGADALRVAEGHAGPIHLLLTDVVMPGMTGPKLAERLCTTRSETKVLYMSAHTTEHVANYGVFPGDPLIAKPFTVMGLAHRVRQMLNSRLPFGRPRAKEDRP
jgi:two-component system, cell cycle sensor histidine kinase and response regulator CckA